MTERDIFLDALNWEEPAARAAYLDAACAGQPVLRRRVEELLRRHGEDTAFLNVPVMEQLAAAEESLAFLGSATESGSLGRLDRYEVLEVVGRGATGVVLQARDTKLQRVVAVKLLARQLAASASARRRFVREAQAAAAVRDDHVVAIYEVHDGGPLPFLVMEYIAGVTLEDVIRRGTPPDLRDVLRIGSQIARGLAAAHARGLVHSDVKPANILLESGVPRVRITDFGLARAAADPAECGVIAGTPPYMSPEQARGEPTDHRSDLFSLGSVLYALCTGRPPFQGDTAAEVLRSVREDRPRPIRESHPGVPEWLCGLIGRLHAKEPGDRFATAHEVGELLGDHLALALPPAARRRRLWWFGAGLAAVALAAVALAEFAARAKPGNRPGSDAPPVEAAGVYAGPVTSLDLRREDIPPILLTLAGGGDPVRAPQELAAVLGDGRFLLPRAGQTAWMEQSPDGNLFAVPLDGDVALLDPRTGNHLRTLTGPGGRVFHVTFSRDSQLFSASTRVEEGGAAVRVWNLGADRVLFTNPQPGPTISCATAFSADGQHLFTEGNGRILVYETRTGVLAQELAIHPRGLGPMCVSPDGRRLAVAVFFDRRVMVFDWDGKRLTGVRTLEGHSAPVGGLAYSPDGKFLASGDSREFKLWDADTLNPVRAVETPAGQIAFAPDGRTVFGTQTIEQPRPVHTFTRWDVGDRGALPPLAVEVSVEPVRAFHCLSRDGRVLFVTPQHSATYVRAFDTDTGRELYPRAGHVAPLHVVAVSPDGRTAASAGEDWAVITWDLATGRVRHSLKAHTGTVGGLAFSPDGKLLASGSLDGTIAVWNAADGTLARALLGHSRSSSRLRFSADGKRLAAGGEKGTVKVWDVATGRECAPLPGHTGVVRSVAVSPDGRWVASGGEDRVVLLHHPAEGRSRKFLTPTAVNDVAFSPDGRTLAAVCDVHVPSGVAPPVPKTTVHLWDLETGAETALEGHTGNVHGLAFSPTAPLLATCGADGTVRLWDRGGESPGVRTIGPGPFGGGVRAVAFTPDGCYLITANGNGTAYALRVGRPGSHSPNPARGTPP